MSAGDASTSVRTVECAYDTNGGGRRPPPAPYDPSEHDPSEKERP